MRRTGCLSLPLPIVLSAESMKAPACSILPQLYWIWQGMRFLRPCRGVRWWRAENESGPAAVRMTNRQKSCMTGWLDWGTFSKLHASAHLVEREGGTVGLGCRSSLFCRDNLRRNDVEKVAVKHV